MEKYGENSFLSIMIPEMPNQIELAPYLRSIDNSRIYSNFGPLETKVREVLANFIDNAKPPKVVTVANATMGLELLIRDLNLPYGSFICIPNFTFAATASAVKRCGHNIVLADIDESDWLLKPTFVKQLMQIQKIDAVIPVSTFGRSLNERIWDDFFLETGCSVIIDAATALGKQKPGLYCPAVYSLHATKAIAAGEGGVLALRNSNKSNILSELTNFGFRESELPKVAINNYGGNFKLSEYHAAVFLATFKSWPTRKKWRDALERRYRGLFSAFPFNVGFQGSQKGMINNYMNICLPEDFDVISVMKLLHLKGIGTHRWYLPLINKHPAFYDAKMPLPTANCDALANNMLSLPFHNGVTNEDLNWIGEQILWFAGSEHDV